MRKVNCIDAEGLSLALSTLSVQEMEFPSSSTVFMSSGEEKINNKIVFILHILLRSESVFPAVTKASNDVGMYGKIIVN